MSRLIIEAEHAERGYWSDLWRYRELFFFLSKRDILVRYKADHHRRGCGR